MDDTNVQGWSPETVQEIFKPYIPTPPPPTVPSHEDLKNYLQDVFGLQAFRPLQLQVIQTIMSDRDCFIRMATGSGKSLLWQLPAVCQRSPPSLTVVVCPTISLIQDQMRRLCQISSPTFFPLCYYGTLPTKLKEFTLWLLRRPNIGSHCLLLTPCQLDSNPIKLLLEDYCKSNCLARFVIDEADKFLAWGQSFYSEYLKLQDLRKDFPKVPIVAMTGSISNDDMEHCITKLRMHNCAKFSDSLDRPNLCYEIRPKQKGQAMIKDILELTKRKGSASGIVYCASQNETRVIAALLKNKHISAEGYHGDLSETDKKDILTRWKEDKITVVVATSAFGMGIDKPNVRWVIHDTMPSSVESWFQESGRAGRDGFPSHCIIYFQIEDYCRIKALVAKKTHLNLAMSLKPLHQLTEILMDHTSCRRKKLLAYFSEEYSETNCRSCDFCIYFWATPQSWKSVTVDAQNALALLQQMRILHSNWTEKHLAEAIFGKTTEKRFKELNLMSLGGFGCGFLLKNEQRATISKIQEFILLLIQRGVFTEYEHTGGMYKHYYIKPSAHAEDMIAAMGLQFNGAYYDAIPDGFALDRVLGDRNREPRSVHEYDAKSGTVVEVHVIDD